MDDYNLRPLTPVFGMEKIVIKMALNERVPNMKTFRMVKMNIFDVWVITIRSHLAGRRCARSAKIWHLEYCLTDYSTWICLRLVEAIDFEF